MRLFQTAPTPDARHEALWSYFRLNAYSGTSWTASDWHRSVLFAARQPGCRGGFEFPLTDRTDVLHNRLYVDLILRY